MTAETRRELHVEMNEKQTVWKPTGETVWRCSTRIFGIQIPLTFVGVPKGAYRRETAVSPFVAGGVTLPVSIFTENGANWSSAR